MAVMIASLLPVRSGAAIPWRAPPTGRHAPVAPASLETEREVARRRRSGPNARRRTPGSPGSRAPSTRSGVSSRHPRRRGRARCLKAIEGRPAKRPVRRNEMRGRSRRPSGRSRTTWRRERPAGRSAPGAPRTRNASGRPSARRRRRTRRRPDGRWRRRRTPWPGRRARGPRARPTRPGSDVSPGAATAIARERTKARSRMSARRSGASNVSPQPRRHRRRLPRRRARVPGRG
jgi:hypothetical protein